MSNNSDIDIPLEDDVSNNSDIDIPLDDDVSNNSDIDIDVSNNSDISSIYSADVSLELNEDLTNDTNKLPPDFGKFFNLFIYIYYMIFTKLIYFCIIL